MRRRSVLLVVPVLALLTLAGPSGAQSSDPGLQYQWGLNQIGAPAAWQKATGAGVRIGIVDTGIDRNHSDLKGKIVEATTCLGTTGNPSQCSGSGQDDHGHGTHVAGIAAAARNNGHGVVGVAPDAQLLVAKVLDSEGSGSADDIEAGVKWLLSKDVDVVNLSLGDAGIDPTGEFGILCNNSGFKDLLNSIWEGGAVPVFAAGNCGGGLLGGGANFENTNAFIVGATNIQGNKTTYTNDLYSAQWGLVAPGGEPSCDPGLKADNPCIFSTFWTASHADAYAYMAGTSMAAPHVSGAVAVLLSQKFSKEQAVNRILATLSKGPCGDGCQGRLDLAHAVGSGPTGPPPTTSPTTRPAGGTTATTKAPKKSTATTRPSTATTVDLSETELPTTTEVTEEMVVGDGDDDFELADEPFQGDGDDRRPSDDGVNGPLAVLATLGVLGVGGTAAPFALRFFRGAAGR